MNTSKLFMRTLSMSLANAMIVMTLILSPIPFSRSADALAADSVAVEPSCADRENDSSQVYKAGCKFNEDLNKTDIKDPYRDGIPGIFEQMIGGLFAMISIELLFSSIPAPMVGFNCPTHIASSISIPMVTAGSLAYLIGEVRGNLAFQEASKMAVDKNFQARKDESYLRTGAKEDREKSRAEAKVNENANDKQVASFNALEEIYKKQAEGINNKKNLVRFAQTAFIGAEAVEAGDLVYNAYQASTLLATQVSIDTGLHAGVNTLSTSIAATNLCPELVSVIGLYNTTLGAHQINTAGIASAQTSKSLMDTGKSMVQLLFNLNPVSLITNMFTSLALNVGYHEAEKVEQMSFAVNNSAIQATMNLYRIDTASSLGPLIAACGTKIATALSVTPAITYPVYNAALVLGANSLGALPEAWGAMQAHRFSGAVTCTGAESTTIPTLDSPLHSVSALGIKVDRFMTAPDISIVNNSNQLKSNELFYFEKIISNGLHEMAMNKIHRKKNISPSKKISEIAASTQYVNYVVGELLNKIKSNVFDDEINKKIRKIRNNEMEMGAILGEFLADLKNNLISTATANSWMDLLKFVGKIYIALKVLSITFKNFGFSKPALRMFTYGLMATLNGSVNEHLEKVESESKERAELVAKERELFIESNPLRGEDLTGVTAHGGKLSITTTKKSDSDPALKGKLACGVANGKSIAPAVCPSKLLPSVLNTPTGNAKFLTNGGLLGNTAKLASSIGTSIGRGDSLAPGSTAGANLAALEGSRNALIKKRDELRKKVDDLNKKLSDSLGKNNKGKEVPKLTSVAAATANFKKLLSGNASATGEAFSSIKSGKIPDLNKLKKLEKENGAKSAGFSVPSFSMPTPSNNGFDFGDSSGEGVAVEDKVETPAEGQNLEEFVINTEEINENENVDIFKLISNRYLVSNPKLLEEKL